MYYIIYYIIYIILLKICKSIFNMNKNTNQLVCGLCYIVELQPIYYKN